MSKLAVGVLANEEGVWVTAHLKRAGITTVVYMQKHPLNKETAGLVDFPEVEDDLQNARCDVKVLDTATRIITDRFNAFLALCVDENGKPKAPTAKDVAKARGYMPTRCSMSFTPKVKL